MIIIVDGLNRHRYGRLLDDMFLLRGRVFGDRLGWEVDVKDGREIDAFDALDPAYVIGVDDNDNVVSCVRALQTTGPHMLADVFSAILDGEAPLRSATLWESTRFCVDTQRLERGNSRNSVSYATCELMAGALEYARDSGISDIVTVIDPIMNRVLKRSDCAPYDYVGRTAQMGKVPAMAALLDCTDERIDRVRAFAGIEGDVFVDAERAEALADAPQPAETSAPANTIAFPVSGSDHLPADRAVADAKLDDYCTEQLLNARTPEEREAARNLVRQLYDTGMIAAMPRAMFQIV